MTRRDLLAAAAPLALGLPEMHGVALLMRVSDGTVISGDNPTARTWTLPPGSTCKPFVLQALLEARRLQPTETFLCPGELRVGGHNLSCSHPRSLPPMSVAQVIAYSCNCATARFSQRFTADELAAALRAFGFQVDAVDVRLLALGEEGVLVTPINLANAYRRLAKTAEPEIRAGLEGAVQFGTARLAAIERLHVAGKTGSIVTNNGLHAALFAGFAPSREPRYVATVITQGRSGGADAAPLAAGLFRHQFGLETAPTAETSYRIRIGQNISSLTVEIYVAAVLAAEAGVFQQFEALKAMAVAARTYAANQKGRHAQEGYDFCNTTHCQRAEPANIIAHFTQAAQATRGELLRYRNSPAFTPYTMSCGGITESGPAIWPGVIAPYLRTQPDQYCSPVSWTRDLLLRDIEQALRNASLRCPQSLQTLSVVRRTSSGRAQVLSLEGNGTDRVSAGAFRFAMGRSLGWDTVRSNWFDIRPGSPGYANLHGKGEGHGVGLCQRGAEAMGARGFSHRDILAFYYPGTSTAEWIRLGGEGIILFVTDRAREAALLPEAERVAARLPWRVEGAIEIYMHPSLDEFRNATHEPGWVAARTEGRRIDLQPRLVLESRGILRSTLYHELLHVAVESRAIPGLPLWFREGLVECLAGGRGTPDQVASSDTQLRDRLNQPEAYKGYRAAKARVAALIGRYGEGAVLDWVAHGLPAEVKNSTASTPPTNSR